MNIPYDHLAMRLVIVFRSSFFFAINHKSSLKFPKVPDFGRFEKNDIFA